MVTFGAVFHVRVREAPYLEFLRILPLLPHWCDSVLFCMQTFWLLGRKTCKTRRHLSRNTWADIHRGLEIWHTHIHCSLLGWSQKIGIAVFNRCFKCSVLLLDFMCNYTHCCSHILRWHLCSYDLNTMRPSVLKGEKVLQLIQMLRLIWFFRTRLTRQRYSEEWNQED